jgi:hypothetical protein
MAASAIARRDSNSQIAVPTTPTDSAHAASKGYVDSAVSAAKPIEIVKCYAPNDTTINITLSATPTTTVSTSSFEVYDYISGAAITVSAISGSGASYVLTVAQSQGVGITFVWS